jgi:ssDNA-binding Zn-finger/Zn-ribbon topoisomerase 1
MGDPGDCPKCGKHEKKEVLSIFREMWRKLDSPLHRIYSSWEELEQHVELETGKEANFKVHPCPICGVKQEVTKPLEGFFPFQNCNSCKNTFYVNKDLTVRKLTEEEKREIPNAWIQIVEDLNKKKCAIVFKLE